MKKTVKTVVMKKIVKTVIMKKIVKTAVMIDKTTDRKNK